MSPRYRELFEPEAATVDQRLQNIDRLKGLGMDVEVRIDPVIPFYTDDEISIRRLYEALGARNIKRVSLSYLHLRPAIMNQLQQELPSNEFNVLLACFESQPWTVVGSSTRTKLIPRPLREKGYRRFIGLSEEFGITPLICACKNPDMSAHQCSTGMKVKKTGESDEQTGGQLTLFPC
jgi:DNA repair photolyase